MAHNDDMPRKKRGNVERRGQASRVRIMVGKERHSFTLPTTDKAEIAAFVKRKRAELERAHSRRALGLATGVRMSELFDQYERETMPTLAPGAAESYADSLMPLRQYFVTELGDPTVESIRTKDVLGFMSWRRVNRYQGRSDKAPTKPLSNRTVAKDRAVLHRIFELAVDLEMREANPVARTKAPESDPFNPIILTEDEYEQLLQECADRPMFALYVLLLGETGTRALSEGLKLRWEDVDLEGGFVQVTSGQGGKRTKSGKSRWVPMTPRLLTAMRDHFARYRFATYRGKRSPWVFHHDRDHRQCRAGERIKTMVVGFKGAAARAKLPKALRQHDLRHRRVTTWLADGKNPVHVKEAMGHSDLRTTMGYTHLSREHLRDLVEAPAKKAGPTVGPTATKSNAG